MRTEIWANKSHESETELIQVHLQEQGLIRGKHRLYRLVLIGRRPARNWGEGIDWVCTGTVEELQVRPDGID